MHDPIYVRKQRRTQGLRPSGQRRCTHRLVASSCSLLSDSIEPVPDHWYFLVPFTENSCHASLFKWRMGKIKVKIKVKMPLWARFVKEVKLRRGCVTSAHGHAHSSLKLCGLATTSGLALASLSAAGLGTSLSHCALVRGTPGGRGRNRRARTDSAGSACEADNVGTDSGG